MKPYGCHNQPRPVAGEITHLAQDGYLPPHHVGNGRYAREARWVPIKHVMSTDCRYDKGSTDQRCAGCEHIKVPSLS